MSSTGRDRGTGADKGPDRGRRGGGGDAGGARNGRGRGSGDGRRDRRRDEGPSDGRRGGRPQAGRSGGGAGRSRDDRGGRDARGTRGNDRGRERGGRTDSSRTAGGGRRPARADARSVALAVLTAVRERDAYGNLALPAELRRAKLDEREAALATELTYGTLRTSGLLDRIIALAAERDVTEIDPPVLDLLRLGSYQLLYTRIAAHAAVDTTVEAARTEGLGRAGAFVNAVLRTVSRSTTQEWIDRLRDRARDPIARLAAGSAHPEWIVRAFADALGASAGELPALLDADDARPRVHLAARPGAITAEELALVTGGTRGELSPYAVHLEGGDPGALEPVTEGLAAVQDEGSQLVALACAETPLRGEDSGRWLDLCAGPGGKATLLGALAEIEGGTLTAVEVTPHRADLVREAVRDLPVEVVTADGRDPGLEPGFDRVLLDAPCSGLGALRRRPESRWRRTPQDVTELVGLQRELLASALRLVRPGGVVLYATCSPHLSETVSVVREALRRPDVESVDLAGVLDRPEAGDPWIQLWPHRDGTDAMFLAALTRTGA